MTDKVKSILKTSLLNYMAETGQTFGQLAKSMLYLSSLHNNIYSAHGNNSVRTSSIDAFIEDIQSQADEVALNLIEEVAKFCVKNLLNAEPAIINFEIIKLKSKIRGIEITNDKFWIEHYLKSIPILDHYDLDFNAYVRYYNEFEDCILISKVIGSLLRTTISKMITYYLSYWQELNYEKEKTEGIKNLIIGRTNISPIDIESIAKDLFTVCKYIAMRTPEITKEFNFIQVKYELKSTFNEAVSMSIYEGAYNFSILHEVAHIIHGHNPIEKIKTNEIDADVLAQNINLWDKGLANEIYLGHPRGLIFYVFKALGPIILLNIFCVIRQICNNEENDTHPQAGLRKQILNIVSLSIFSNSSEASNMFRQVNKYIDELFEKSCSMNGYNFSGTLSPSLSSDIPGGSEFILYANKVKFNTPS